MCADPSRHLGSTLHIHALKVPGRFALPKLLAGYCRVEANSSGGRCTPCEFPVLQHSGVSGRVDCTLAVGPHGRRVRMQSRRRSRVSRVRMLSRTAQFTGQTDYKILAWRSPPNGDRRCSSHLSHHQIKCTRNMIQSISESPVCNPAARQKTPKS